MGDVLSSNPRLEMLRSFAEKRPQDPFPRYALAMELKSTGDTTAAWQVFEAMIADHPDYIASYAPAGEVLVELGRVGDARAVYDRGIAACTRKNDAHTRDHLETALSSLENRA
jgi:predicted RNA polymerase sigma factor